ncbi:Hsp20/alpha crystallin family protein [Streptomonospora litoralis]|nr:Hsp20/alpha crystallin family protein [Streptomonospora litoralis]
MVTQRTGRNPFSGLVAFVNDMNRMSDDMHSRRHEDTRAWAHATAGTLPVDIAASDDQLVVYADLAGVDWEDVDVTFSAPDLVISGVRRLRDGESHPSGRDAEELCWGRFRRDITLPDGVRQADIEVTLSRGLLRVAVDRSTAGADSEQLQVDDGSSPR